MKFLKKNWFVILIGCFSAFLGVLTLATVVKLKTATPVAPTVPDETQSAAPACTLTFKLTLALSPTPSSFPTETLSITPTPTEEAFTATSEEDNQLPVCNELLAQPTSGEAPLKVTFTGSGVDPDGTITAFEFSFDDGEVETVEKDVEGTASHSLNHTYFPSGTYLASLRVKDNDNVWSEISETCLARVEVEESQTPTPTGKAVGGLDKPSLTPTPKEMAQAPTITETPSPTATQAPTATSTPIPVPKLPEAGITLPGILTILSGSLLILLGILL